MAFKWTDEQVTFLQCEDPVIRIRAFAGAAKTTSLVGYTKLRPNVRFLYLAYNKSVRDEAKERFPRNVTPMTTHGIAYGEIGKNYRHKLAGSLRLSDVGRIIGSSNWAHIKLVVETLNGFMASADSEISGQHIPVRSHDHIKEQRLSYLDSIFSGAEMLWQKMIDPEDTEVPMLHDGYLKLFSLSNPDLSKYDAILIDEAQDLNEVTISIVLQQTSARLIFCGDSHQQIYSFRGATNALDHPKLEGSTDLYLTQSFRFGPAVATVANSLLAFKGEQRKVIGSGARTQIKTALPADVHQPAYIHRTVMGVIDTAISFTSKGQKVFWVGGIEAYSIGDIEDLQRLNTKQVDQVKNKRLLNEYGDIESYVEMAEETSDPEMKRAVKILNNYTNLGSRLQQMRKMSVKNQEDADVIVTTAHRSKGLEWNYVHLAEDFIDPLDREVDADTKNEEINLIYVAVTRAKLAIALNTIVISMLREHTSQASVTA